MKSQASPPEQGAFARKAEGIYQYESSGTYYARFRHKGERIMERLGTRETPCTSLPEAKRLLRDLKNRLDRTDTESRKKTLRQLLDEFEFGGKDPGGKEFPPILRGAPKTLSYKKRYLARIRTDFPLPLHTRVRDIKKSDLLKFLAHFNDATADHYNHVLTLVRELFQYALDDQAIDDSPALGIKYRKREDKNKKLFPEWDEFQAIVTSIRSQQYADTAKESADLVQFMGEAGLGQAECAGLKWGHVNFKKKEIVIIRQKTRSEFTIPIYAQLQPLLERMNADRGEHRDPEENVFKVRDPKKSLAEACKRLKLPGYSPRSFRRMFIRRCLNDLGWDVQSVAATQGHQDGGQTILKHYAQGTSKRLHDLASRMVAPQPEAV
jgi:integrase